MSLDQQSQQPLALFVFLMPFLGILGSWGRGGVGVGVGESLYVRNSGWG